MVVPSRSEPPSSTPDPLAAPEFASLRQVRRALSKGGLPSTPTPADAARLSMFYVLQEALRFMEDFRSRVRRGERVHLRTVEQKSSPGRLVIILEVDPPAQEGSP